MSERSGDCERNEQSGASKRVSGASERANGRASGPVLTSRFLFVPDHSASRHLPSPVYGDVVVDAHPCAADDPLGMHSETSSFHSESEANLSEEEVDSDANVLDNVMEQQQRHHHHHRRPRRGSCGDVTKTGEWAKGCGRWVRNLIRR